MCFHVHAQVSVPVPSLLKRYNHSATGFSLGKASEVIVFGGMVGGSLLTHTTVLRLGESMFSTIILCNAICVYTVKTELLFQQNEIGQVRCVI